jgi:hypothetical protein
MKLGDIKAHHVYLLAGGVVLLGAWRVAAALRDAYRAGTLNPASTENIVYRTASVPFGGSLGVWLWELLHPEQAQGANAEEARNAAARAERKRAQESAAARAAQPKLPPLDVDATGTGGW